MNTKRQTLLVTIPIVLVTIPIVRVTIPIVLHHLVCAICENEHLLPR